MPHETRLPWSPSTTVEPPVGGTAAPAEPVRIPPTAAEPPGFGFPVGSAGPVVPPLRGRGEPLGPRRVGVPPGPATATRPAPLPKRPKGRWFVGSVFVVLCATLLYVMWDNWLRYEAYGIVTGRAIHVASPWGGVIQSLRVREGDFVEQDQVLAVLDNVQLQHQLDSLGDDLRVAQANLEAEIVQYQFQTQQRGDEWQKAQAEYYAMWGELLAARAQLSELDARTRRAKALIEHQAVSSEELERLQYQLSGQQSRVEKLELAVAEMKKRVAVFERTDTELSQRCKPQLVRIETLQTELTRLRERLQAGELRAPVRGRVTRIWRFVGEYAGTGQDIMEIVEDGSLEVALFLPQGSAERWQVGDVVRVCIAPRNEPIACVVDRFSDQLEAAPASIQRYYRTGEQLVAMRLRPTAGAADPSPLRLGSEVRLPHAWRRVQRLPERPVP